MTHRHNVFNRSTPLSQRGFSLIELLVVLVILAIAAALLLPPVTRSSRGGARRAQCRNNLKQIGLALHNYHDDYDTFPPAFTVNAEGRPLHSWRTLLLPYLDQQPLYNQLDLSKPWDDPANAMLFEKARVPIFACPSNPLKIEQTTYLAVVSDQSVLRAGKSCSLKDITDGTSNTLVILEVTTDHAVPWMAPQDADAAIISEFLGTSPHAHTGGGHALLADGSARFLSQNIDKNTLQGLITVDGKEPVSDF